MNQESERVELIVLQPVVLVLLDLEALMPILRGVVMELTDCSLPLIKGTVSASSCAVV